MSRYTQEQEMKRAYKQKRQPSCVHCEHPLDIVMQPQDVTAVWRWDKALGQYKRSEEGSAEKPYHYCHECQDTCWAEDWGYVDYRLVKP